MPTVECGTFIRALLTESEAISIVAKRRIDERVVAVLRLRRIPPNIVNVGPLIAESAVSSCTWIVMKNTHLAA